jgi:endoglucanase Acf2
MSECRRFAIGLPRHSWIRLHCSGRASIILLVLGTGLHTAPASADDIVRIGAGSYTTRAPDGTKQPQKEIFRTAAVQGPMPTNDWWSSLAWKPFSDSMYPHPLASRTVPGGLRVYYPGPNITANSAAIFGFMPGETDDFVIGHSVVPRFEEARVDGFSDWFVSVLFNADGKQLRASFGHGSPFVFSTIERGEPTVTFAAPPKVWSGSANGAVLGISIQNRHYGLFAPSGSTWTDLSKTKWAAKTKGKNYFAVAVLPDDKPETLAHFRSYAYSHVTDTRVAWSYDEKRCVVETEFNFTTKTYEGAPAGTLFALYPHQWRHTNARLLAAKYESVRGPMRIGEGESFRIEISVPGVLPALPLTENVDKTKLARFLAVEVADKGQLVADTYWLGKQLGKWATLIPIAEQAGENATAEALTNRTRKSLENFLSAADAQGKLKKASDGSFFYDANWGTLIGYPASYGSDNELNDHHFHYGYFLRAAGELARRDPAWAADEKWGGMLKLLIRDIASTDRRDPLFPFLRNFDPYAGHTWASGHAKFGDGNNNESSSEAVNAWYGLILLGVATGDKALRDLGIWLLATEIAAINDYWFDVTGKFHHADYSPSVVTMVWGGKGANGTWFSGNPELVHGINWLPFTGASLYLGRYPDYCARNYAALVSENKEEDRKQTAKAGKPALSKDGTYWDQWADIVWMYRALNDPQDAVAQFNSRPSDFKPETGNSMANVYAWLMALDQLGQVDRTVTADTPFYAVFRKNGRLTHVAYNFGSEPRPVTFSDGVMLVCPPRSFGMK